MLAIAHMAAPRQPAQPFAPTMPLPNAALLLFTHPTPTKAMTIAHARCLTESLEYVHSEPKPLGLEVDPPPLVSWIASLAPAAACLLMPLLSPSRRMYASVRMHVTCVRFVHPSLTAAPARPSPC
jgi:hypothetical protein